MASDPGASLPLSHPIRVETIKLRGTAVVVRPEGPALEKIARMLDLASLESLEGRYELSRNGERVKLEGEIKASLHQTCIVTLEPFPVELRVPVKLDFAPEAEAQAAARRSDSGDEDDEIDIEVRLNEDDPPEPILDGVIELGAVTLEFLALALDPYPRKPGASFDTPAAGNALESPFAALDKLKRSE